MMKLFSILTFFIIGLSGVFAQKDSIVFNNGNFLVGEVKTMNRNVIKVETDYSDADFAIEWNGIKEIYTKTFFLITLTDGSRYNGTLKSIEPGKISIVTDEGKTVEVNRDEIVILDDIDQGFWSQLHASIDAKYDLPLDFYIKLGYTLNFDNQPATGSSKTDYVFHSGIGWEW